MSFQKRTRAAVFYKIPLRWPLWRRIMCAGWQLGKTFGVVVGLEQIEKCSLLIDWIQSCSSRAQGKLQPENAENVHESWKICNTNHFNSESVFRNTHTTPAAGFRLWGRFSTQDSSTCEANSRSAATPRGRNIEYNNRSVIVLFWASFWLIGHGSF